MTEPLSATPRGFSNITEPGNAALTDGVSADLIGILDTVDLPIVVITRDFKVARFNRPAASALSLTPSNIGQSPRRINVFADLVDLEGLCEQAISEGVPYRREVRHGDRWFVLRVAPYTGGDEQTSGTVLTLTNVTALRASVEQAIYEREYTKTILNTVIEPLVVLDAGLRVQTANRAFYTMFQVSRDETQGVPLNALPNHAWDALRLWPQLEESLVASKEFPTLEVEHNFPGIGRRTLLIDARLLTPTGSPRNLILLAFQDISERKRAESELRASEARYRNLYDSIDEGFCIIQVIFDERNRPVDYVFLEVNPSFERQTGVQNARGRRMRDIAPRHEEHWFEMYGKIALSGEAKRFEYPAVELHRWYEGYAYRIGDAPERKVGIIFNDITERKQAEDRLQEAKRQAEAASSAKDRFLAVLSHELRTPLTPVLMSAVAMDANPDLAPNIRENVAMIRRNVELEVKLIDDLLDLSRVSAGKLRLQIEAVDVNSAVRHVCETCRPFVLEKGIQLHCNLPAATMHVKADVTRLQQVLWNVIKNAAKFTPAHGDIYVNVAKADGDRVRIEVRDTGVGIASQVLPKIFNAFEQGNASNTPRFGGMGLGLAISKALVEMHHGTIRAESDGPGAGSTFTVELPAESAPKDSCDSPTKQRKGNGSPLRVLVVEDHEDTAFMLVRMLGTFGHTVRTAGTVATALELASKELFDVVVSDIGLPDATGHDLMREIQARQPLKGIAMSGYGMDEDVCASREAGFSDHIVKPVNVDQLERTIRRVVGRSE